MKKEIIIEILEKKSICDFGGIGDFHDKDKVCTVSCYLKNSKELAGLILELIEAEKKKWVRDLKQGKICTSCGKEKEKDLCGWCPKCMEEN